MIFYLLLQSLLWKYYNTYLWCRKIQSERLRKNSWLTYINIYILHIVYAYSIKMDEETSMPFFQWMKTVVDGRKSSIAGEMTLTERLEARKWRIIVHARRWSTTGYRTVRIRRCVDADRLGFQSFFIVCFHVLLVSPDSRRLASCVSTSTYY